MSETSADAIAEGLRLAGADKLPGHLGFEVVELGEGKAHLRCDIDTHHLAPNGYLHAGAVVALADTAAGYGCMASLPSGGVGFTTIELKVNFLSTLLEGSMMARGELLHGGRTTQVWDVRVSDEQTGKTMAEFRCTQLVLYPRS